MCISAFHLCVVALVNGGCTSCALLPLIRNVIEYYNSTHAVPVVLWATDGSSIALDSWVRELPISRVVGTPHDLLPNVFWSYNTKVLKHLVAYFVPMLPDKLPQMLNKIIAPDYFPLFPQKLILVSRAGREIEHSGVSKIINRIRRYCSPCEILSINETALYVWSNESRSCKIRLQTMSLEADAFHEQDGRRYMRNVRIFVEINPVTVARQYNSSAPPEMLAYLNALDALNVTPVRIPTIELFNDMPFEDVFITPETIISVTGGIDRYAVYGYSGVGLFTKKYPTAPGSSVAWWSVVALFVLVVPLVGSFVAFVFRGDNRLFPEGSDRLPTIFAFLVAAILVRCPPYMRISFIALRILKAAWLLGAFVIACSIQCFLTSERNVPAYSRPVQTLDELYELFRLGKMSPCIVSFGYTFGKLYQYKDNIFFRKGASGSRKVLSFQNPDDCYFRALNGTAAFINIADAPTMQKAHEFGLTRANDLIDPFYTAAAARKAFRYIRQHHRLVRALAESGLIIREERKHGGKQREDILVVPSVPLWNQMTLFIWGFVASVFVLIGEVVHNKFYKSRGMIE